MSRPRTMGAGLAGSMTKNVNVNQVQIGDKLQGLAPQATHFFIAGNGRAGWNQYRTRTNGNKRNFVFCMNQLGGVGASRSQFKIRGLNKPDGTGNCLAGPYSLKDKIEYLRRYFLGLLPGYTLCLVGEHELIRADLEGCSCMDGIALPGSGDPFLHLTDTAYNYADQPLSQRDSAALAQAFHNDLIRNMVVYVNSQCNYITGTGCSGAELGTHTLGLVPDDMITVLHKCSYGLRSWHGLHIYHRTAEGTSDPCSYSKKNVCYWILDGDCQQWDDNECMCNSVRSNKGKNAYKTYSACRYKTKYVGDCTTYGDEHSADENCSNGVVGKCVAYETNFKCPQGCTNNCAD